MASDNDTMAWVELLDNEEDWVCRYAEDVLCEEIGPSAVPALARALAGTHEHIDTAARLVGCIGRIGGPRTIDPLIRALDHPSPAARCLAAETLGRMAPPRALQPLLDKLEAIPHERYPAGFDPFPDSLMRALGDFGHAAAVEPLTVRLGSPRYRTNAAEALAWLGSRRAVDPLIEILHNRELLPADRFHVLLRDERAVPPLVDMLQHGTSERRAEAAAALGRIGDRRAAQPLVAALDDGDPAVRFHARVAASRLGRAEPAREFLADLENPRRDIRACAAKGLGDIGCRPAIDPLAQALQDRYWIVRSMAAQALERLGDTRGRDTLLQYVRKHRLNSPRSGMPPSVECGYVSLVQDNGRTTTPYGALWTTGGRWATEASLVLLRSADSLARRHGADDLGRSAQPQDAGPPLSVALRSRDWVLRFLALGALRRLGDARLGRAVEAVGQVVPDEIRRLLLAPCGRGRPDEQELAAGREGR